MVTRGDADGWSIDGRRLRLGPAIVWADDRMRRALAVRDIGMVYRLLNQAGVSQRKIAMCTDQSQSEISEILNGRRVTAYDVLVRICDGLGARRSWMGLAVDLETAHLIGGRSYGIPDPAEADVASAARRVHRATLALMAALNLSP
jgi:transcriptional regulator with XRE-family HTH domain